MAKRFTDSDKWKKAWFRKLTPAYKCFWVYLLDNCTNAGIWDVDFESASFHVGEDLNALEVMQVFQKQYLPFALGKRWFVIDFIDFQYGELKSSSNAHIAVINALKKQGLYETYLNHRKLIEDVECENQSVSGDLGRDPRGVLDKDQDKDKDQDLNSLRDQDPKKEEDQDPAILQNVKSRLKILAASEILNSEQPRRKGRAKAARTVCPEDFAISDEIREYCRKKEHPDPEQFRDSFVNYWRGRGDLMADWVATFRNYMDGPFRQDKLEKKYGTNSRPNSHKHEKSEREFRETLSL
jgi:hypothetical protein